MRKSKKSLSQSGSFMKEHYWGINLDISVKDAFQEYCKREEISVKKMATKVIRDFLRKKGR